MQKQMHLFAGRLTDEVSSACIARSFEQQRAIYGIIPMINGMALARGTLPPCFPILLCPSACSSFSFSHRPVCHGLHQRATSHRPILGPTATGASELAVHEPADELFGYHVKKHTMLNPYCRADRISSARLSVPLFILSSRFNLD